MATPKDSLTEFQSLNFKSMHQKFSPSFASLLRFPYKFFFFKKGGFLVWQAVNLAIFSPKVRIISVGTHAFKNHLSENYTKVFIQQNT